MNFFQGVAALLSLTALFNYVNHRFIKLPTTIGVMLISLLISLGLVALGRAGVDLHPIALRLLQPLDFDDTLMQGMLSFLLFAGSLHLDLGELSEQKWVVTLLATAGVLLSTLLFGGMIYFILGWMGLGMNLTHCLLFGALISPTDPIAVLAILKRAGVPRSLEIQIAGESLFNDGVGVVFFLILAELASGGVPFSAVHVGELFLREAVGGVLFGLVLGWMVYRLLKSVDNPQLEVMLTLALVTGGYALARVVDVSGPIAIVVAGLLIGNHGRRFAMSPKTLEHLDNFWMLVDEILNAALFVLLGLEILLIPLPRPLLYAGLAALPAILLARWISVGLPVTFMRRYRRFTPGAVRILTWGGLRGGISVALALSIPAGPQRGTIVAITYIIVVFSILVQGLTLGPLARRIAHGAAVAG